MIRAALIIALILSSLGIYSQTPEVAQSLPRNAFSKILDEGTGNYYISWSMADAYGYDVDFDRDSTFILNQNSGQDYYLVKYDINDSLLWSVRLKGTTLKLRDVCYDPKGDVVLSLTYIDSLGIGDDSTFRSATSESALVKLSPSDGSLRSYHPFQSNGTVDLVKLQIINGEYLICLNGSDSVDIDLRTTATKMIGSGTHTVKMRWNGSVLWYTREHPFSYSEFSTDTSGGIYIKTYINGAKTRIFESPGNLLDTAISKNGYEYIIYKRDKDGKFQFANFIDAGQLYIDRSSTSENGLYIAGFANNSDDHAYEFQNGDTIIKEGGGYGSFLAYMHPNGDLNWYRHFDDQIWDVFYNVGHDKDDHAYCSGRFRDTLDADWGPREYLITPSSFGNELSAYVVKYSTDATFAGAFSIPDVQQSDQLFTLSGNRFMMTGYSRYGRDADFDPGKPKFLASPDSVLRNDYLAIYSFHDILYDTLYRQTCKDRLELYGKTYTQSGTYLDTLEDNFRTHYLTIVLKMLLPTNERVKVSGCDSVTVNGVSYFQSGVYYQDLKNDAGCDSTLTLFVDVFESKDTMVRIESCEAVNIQDSTYDRTGLYTHRYVSPNGCDSAVTYDIYIIPKDTGIIYAENCSFAVIHGKVYKETGTYYERIKKSGQCDSVLVIDVEIFGRDTTSRQVVRCVPVELYDKTLDKTGIYYFNLQSQNGCDSTIVVDFRLTPRDTVEFSINSCGPFQYRDTVLDSDGTHYYSGTGTCDTVFEINLQVTPMDLDVRRSGDTLIVDQVDGSFQWRDCILDEDIAGATDRKFRPMKPGEYEVGVKNASCTDTSDCFEVDQLDVWSFRQSPQLHIFPNPTDGKIQFVSDALGEKRIRVFAVDGKLVYEEMVIELRHEIDLQTVEEGVYLIEVIQKENSVRKRVVKY